VASSVVILESSGTERRIAVGGLKRLYRRPAQRPRHKFVEAVSDEATAKLLSAFGHPQRVAIMKAIFSGAGTYADLREKVPLKAGPMYHHLRELRLAGVLADGARDVYRLTPRGRDALILACTLMSIHG
jgi:DNA-binding HxlR family transcriptional regulator